MGLGQRTSLTVERRPVARTTRVDLDNAGELSKLSHCLDLSWALRWANVPSTRGESDGGSGWLPAGARAE